MSNVEDIHYALQLCVGGGPDAVDKACLLGKSEIAGSNPALAFKFQRKKCFFHAQSSP